MADRRTRGGRKIITTGRLAAAVLLAASTTGVIIASAAPTVDRIDLPAQATATAVRVTPPGPSIGGCPVFPTNNAWNTD
ncbi:MAG: hypothetical protein JWN99_805, partial [Ilumatobacteraceae bacterium]|nr:hypothetical protein [Ilumatobacteraceae bacterium]